MKIIVAGDWHGDCNAPWVASNPSVPAARKANASSIVAVDNAVRYGAQHIIQCGDFGLWPGWTGLVYLDRLNAALVEAGVYLTWLDGNHEDFNQLDHFVANNPQNKDGQVYVRSNILYSPRGCGWKWDNKRFLTVGGAVSVDRQWRKPNVSWWEQEQITDAQVHGIVNNAVSRRERGRPEVDYMFTHDCHPVSPFRERLKDDWESTQHREKIREIAAAVRPGMWFHGHMHQRYQWELCYDVPFSLEDSKTTKVFGLADGREADSWGILDTETDTFTFDTDRRKAITQ